MGRGMHIAAALALALVSGCAKERGDAALAAAPAPPGGDPPAATAAELSGYTRRVLAALRRRRLAELIVALPAVPEAGLPLAAERLERVALWPPAGGVVPNDEFRYTLIADPVGERFWVQVTGGFMGVYELRGPAVLRAEER